MTKFLFLHELNANKKTPPPRLNKSWGRDYISWYHPSLLTCHHINLFRYGIKLKYVYPSSITGAPVTISLKTKFQCDTQRLVSIKHSYSFSPSGALCKELILSTLLIIVITNFDFIYINNVSVFCKGNIINNFL